MKINPVLLGLTLAVACSTMAAAQDASTTDVPKVLQITREYTKPYKNGAAHDKTESAFVTAMSKAKFPAYYVGMNSISGKARSLYLTRYASFAEWEKDNKLTAGNSELATSIENASLADGELLEEVDSTVFTYDADLSFHSHSDLANHRVYQIYSFHVRPGHRKEWMEVVKMVKDAHEKAGDKAHWGMYELAFGGPDGTYVALSGDPSMSMLDDMFAGEKKFVESMGGDAGMAKLDELMGEAVDASHAELFTVNPKQSYVPQDWIQKAPDFWQQKTGDSQ
ncbi:MAG TPA: hypothetical protein VK716_17450 [Terracidiphilus sp.]|jgi:hypothetical protein|nr:hypothetical protein [Terracidiphilus sp.]